MMKYLDIKGTEVVNRKGTVIGTVEDCIIDVKTKRVCSIIMRKNSLLGSMGLLTLDNIKSFEDVIMYNENFYKIGRTIFGRCRGSLASNYINIDIIDICGRRLGTLMDMIIEESTGKIRAIVCSRGFFDDIFSGRKMIMIDNKIVFGKDKIVIEDSNICFTNNISLRKLIK